MGKWPDFQLPYHTSGYSGLNKMIHGRQLSNLSVPSTNDIILSTSLLCYCMIIKSVIKYSKAGCDFETKEMNTGVKAPPLSLPTLPAASKNQQT